MYQLLKIPSLATRLTLFPADKLRACNILLQRWTLKSLCKAGPEFLETRLGGSAVIYQPHESPAVPGAKTVCHPVMSKFQRQKVHMID